MVYEVIMPADAEQDVDEAILWYEEQQTGLGLRFYFSLLQRLESLKANPTYYTFIHKEYRRITIDPFPYSIVYKVYDTTVVVLAVFHQSKNPAALLKRIKE
jgi:plasmid stabilization system protein ParE